MAFNDFLSTQEELRYFLSDEQPDQADLTDSLQVTESGQCSQFDSSLWAESFQATSILPCHGTLPGPSQLDAFFEAPPELNPQGPIPAQYFEATETTATCSQTIGGQSNICNNIYPYVECQSYNVPVVVPLVHLAQWSSVPESYNSEADSVYMQTKTTVPKAEQIADEMLSHDRSQDSAIPKTALVNHGRTLRSQSEARRSFACNAPSCQSEAFTRQSDLNRHMRLHQKETPFLCPVIGCTNRSRCSRKDKVREHLRRHGESALLRCPVPGCLPVPLEMQLLLRHLNTHTSSQRDFIRRNTYPELYMERPATYYRGFRSIIHDVGRKRICPISPCYKGFDNLNELCKHLVDDHDERSRAAQSSNVCDMLMDSHSCNFICPFCYEGIDCYSTPSRSNLVLDHMLPHLVDMPHWKALCQMIEPGFDSDAPFSVYNLLSRIPHMKRKCPECSFTVDTWSMDAMQILRDHREVFLDTPAIRQHRAGLLRMFPWLDKHPMFDDLIVQPSNVPAWSLATSSG
ncbi:hypothetical protein BT63DRAFT_458090 [Microthyrium microscopicum]|uniref:C2H2-type domain-containing protein n=1 Tax=Microthyrium microscopicum TaxID=703497 RepID=A0A6A6U4A9_9PEZI|nr:hypothetical protein BT63DRAFT_458090 [Microthyrium microscopicum]